MQEGRGVLCPPPALGRASCLTTAKSANTHNLERHAMKASRYNFFFQDCEGNHYAFNGLSGGLLQLSETDSQEIQEILAHLSDCTIKKDIESGFWDPLRQGSFVLDDEVDELEILKARNRLVRFSGNRLFLTVVTTHSCNLRCTYCFQEHHAESMRANVQDLLVDFVATSIKSCKELHVHWYGGEPLLCSPVIRSLSSHFREICEASGCRYSSSMSTNGFLLREEVTAELSQVGLEAIQVTLDGPPDIHDKRRPSVNGQGTFEVILDNVVAATQHVAVVLRVNIDRENISRVPELLDILEVRGLGKEVLCDFVPVAPLTPSCQSDCFSMAPDDELRDVMRKVAKSTLDRGLGLRLPSIIKASHCIYDDVNSFVIDTDGRLYKCSVGEETSVGQLDGTDPRKFRLDYLPWVKWIAIDPFADAECRECRVLPLCMGGCTFKGLTFGKKSKCPVWKEHPEEYVLLNVAAGITQPIP